MNLIIFTELDEILFNPSEADRQSIAAVVERLKQKQVPLIPITSKTRAEVEPWLDEFSLTDPFIVERGSGIFIHRSDSRFNTSGTNQSDRYYIHQQGCSYTEARAALKAVQEEINKILRGFGDMDESGIQALIGGTQPAARQAKAREFSEYFLTPNRLEIEQLQKVAVEYGFQIIAGDSLSLILGAGANIARSMEWLKQKAIAESNIQTVGLGCTKRDLAMLETVDLPIVIPTAKNDSNFGDRNWQTANCAGVSGWIESIEQLCRQHL